MMGKSIYCGKGRSGGRALRRAIPLGLSLALAMGAAWGPALAVAAPEHVYESASIAVTQPGTAANDGATFDAYKLFDADIDESNKASHIAWASDAAKGAALAFFDTLPEDAGYAAWLASNGRTQANARDNAQNAAEFIADKIAHDSEDADFGGSPRAKAANSFADRFARALRSSAVEKTTTDAQGRLSDVTEGYYLIVTTPSSIGDDEFGSAPMWVPLGGSITTVQSKEAKGSARFQVKEDSTATFGEAADSNNGQDLEYRIVSMVPDNIGAYANYHERYVITFPEGVITAGTSAGAKDRSTSSFKVLLGERDITASAFISSSGNVVTVDLADLRNVGGAAVKKGDIVTIGYKAHLGPNAVLGSAGQQTVAMRTYTNDPVTLADGTASPLVVRNFAYQAKIETRDKSNHEPVEGATFTIRARTDQGDLGDYLQGDGSLGPDPYEFSTDENGVITVSVIDEGVYTVHETGVPDGFMPPDSDTVMTVTSKYDLPTGTMSFAVTVTGGEAADVDGDESTRVLDQDAESGTAHIQIVNERAFKMPVTGLRGNAGVYAFAAVLGLTGVTAFAAGALRNRWGNRK